MATVRVFTELEIWRLANELEKKNYDQLQKGTLSKDFELKNQMNKSAGSIMDNIAEGFGRGGRLEFVQFLTIARGSASELQSQIIRCLNRNHFSQELFEELNELADKVGKKTGAMIKYLNQSMLKGPKFMNRTKETNMLKEDETEYLTGIGQNEKRGTRDGEHTITSEAAQPLGSYPHARRAGNLLFLSGIGSRSAKDNSIPGLELSSDGKIIKYNIEAECHSVFANVKAVLEAAGSNWQNIIDVTVFLTNMKNDFAAYNKIYNDYFKDVQACRTTVEVLSLPTPIAIELKVIATIGQKADL